MKRICRIGSLKIAVLVVCVCLCTHDNLWALQVVSPSTAPNTHRRNMRAAGIKQDQPGPQNIEPSRQLLLAMDSMIPFDVVGSSIEEALQGAARKFLTGSPAEAFSELEALRKQQPTMPPAASLMADMFYKAGKREPGHYWLEKSALDHPDHPSAFLGFARFSVTGKRVTDADAMLQKVDLMIQSGTWTVSQTRLFRIEYLDILTDVHVNRHQLKEAKVCLLKLKEMLANNGKIPIRLAQIEFDLGDVNASMDYLRDAIELNQSIRMPEVIIADWFTRKKDYAKSEEWITKASSQYPDNVSVQIDYSRWLLQNERIPEARSVVGKAEQLGGDAYIIGFLKGQIAFAQQSYDLAEMHFEQILNLKAGDADATNMLALSLIESTDTRKHERALELAMINQRMFPKSPTAMATLGWIYYRSGKKQEAENAFRAVIASNNLAPVAAYYVATYLNERGDTADAKNLLEQAVVSQEYFMFRRAAENLLRSVSSQVLDASGTPPDDSADNLPSVNDN